MEGVNVEAVMEDLLKGLKEIADAILDVRAELESIREDTNAIANYIRETDNV
jgi:hypothetical protein